MRAVIYCRVSSLKQIDNLSLPTQQRECIEYCRRNGYDVDKVFVERGESAKTADRTELIKLLAYCRENKGRLHAVVVYAVSRFCRDKYSHVILRAQLAGLGITLRSVTEPIDDSSAGKLMEGIVSAFAQFDNDVRSERTVAGMKARLERGDWTFPPPLGFMKGRNASGVKTILPDPQRAHLITLAFETFATGLHSKQDVLNTVTSLGLTTRGGKRVSPQTFFQLLRKPIYAGIIYVPVWGICRPSNAAALVTREIFDKVQALLDGRRPSVMPRMRNNPDFPLRSFVRCGRCDHPLTASWSKGRNERYAYYRCQNRSCRAVNVKRERIERLFLDFLGELQPKREYMRLFSEIVMDVWKEKQTEFTRKHEAALRRNAELKDRKQRLVEAFVFQRAIDQKTFEEQRDKLNEEIALAELEEREYRIDEMDVQAAISFGEFVLLNAPRLWIELPLDQKQRLQQVLFPRGVQFENDVYRTPETSIVFMNLQAESDEKEGLVALPGIEPGFED